MKQKNKYKCKACDNAEESQEHILVCKTILKIQNDNDNKIQALEKIENGFIKEQGLRQDSEAPTINEQTI